MKKFLLWLVGNSVVNGIVAGGGGTWMVCATMVRTSNGLIIAGSVLDAILWMTGCFFLMKWSRRKLYGTTTA